MATRSIRPTLKSLSDKAGISAVTLRAWRKEGVDVFDSSALAERIARMHGGPGGEAMKRERLRKLKADASLAELELSKRRSDVIDADKVHGLFLGLTLSAIAAFKKLPGELPALLEGMSPSQMSAALLDYRDGLIDSVRVQMEGVFSELGITE